MVALADNVACGIAGWSYPDWDGYVYPRGTRDKLGFIAPYVDAIEINSTFYRPPDPRMVETWGDKTDGLPGFVFTAKLNQDITHGGTIRPAVVEAFHEGLAPLTRRGRLRHLLAQFRYDFLDTPRAREHLRHIRDAFGGLSRLMLELRHNSWQSPDALEFLRGLGVGLANLDYPTGRDSFNLRLCTIGEHAYLRLHGRNYKAWFSKAGRDETYNYRYPPEELRQIVARAVEIARNSKTLTLIANNHYQGKEAANALEIKAMLSGRKVRVPPLLLQRYPDLARIAAEGEGQGIAV